MGYNGLYRPYDLTEFWISPNHHPFFIKQDDELIGFALVESGIEEEPNSILEFFIIQKHAGRGFGKIAANQLFTIFLVNGKSHKLKKTTLHKLFGEIRFQNSQAGVIVKGPMKEKG